MYEINKHKVIKYLTGELPNTKPLPISEFCNYIEINLGMQKDLRQYRHLVGSFAYDYRRMLLDALTTEELIYIMSTMDYPFIKCLEKRKRYDF